MLTLAKKRKRELHKDRFLNKPAYILANGPSINRCDLSQLKTKDCVVIGVNAAPILQEQHDFKLDYLCISDLRFITHPVKSKVLDLVDFDVTTLVLREELREAAQNIPNSFSVKSLGRDGFSENFANGYFFGASTTIMAIQLASFLGVSDIYLLGVDLKYKKDEPRFYQESSPQIEDPLLGVQLHNLIHAKDVLSNRGVGLYVCSSTSFACPYIEYKSFA